MGRSQRHKVIVQGTDSNGKGLSEKQPAPRYINQYANSQPFTNFTGPDGGPLKGSTMVGFPPTLIPPPGLGELTDAELNAEGGFSEPGQFNLSGNPVYTDLPASNEPDEPPPELEDPFGILTMNPDEFPAGYPDTGATVAGAGFEDGAVVVFDGADMDTDFISDNQLNFTLPSSTAAAGPVAVTVRNPGGETTAEFTFTFIEEAQRQGLTEPEAGGRTFPIGPFDISLISGGSGALYLTVPDGSDVRTGDSVTVEATGNTSVNGTYTVSAAANDVVTLPTTYELAGTIDAKGRLIVTGGAA